MHVESANNSHNGGQTSPNAIYNPLTLTWQSDQIVTWQPDKRTRKLGRRRDYIYRGKSEKKYRFLALASLELNTLFLGADSDGMMEGIPLSFFWNSLACIF
jgi:hypothetical protein